jgi:hypothetical protein
MECNMTSSVKELNPMSVARNVSSLSARPALLHTAEGIAEYIGMPVAATRHLIRKRVLPTFRVGRTVMARPERIDQALDALERRTG